MLQAAIALLSLLFASDTRTGIKAIKWDAFGSGAILTSTIDVANTRVGTNDTSIALNPQTVVVADVRRENGIASMENAPAIRAMRDCLKGVGGTTA